MSEVSKVPANFTLNDQTVGAEGMRSAASRETGEREEKRRVVTVI